MPLDDSFIDAVAATGSRRRWRTGRRPLSVQVDAERPKRAAPHRSSSPPPPHRSTDGRQSNWTRGRCFFFTNRRRKLWRSRGNEVDGRCRRIHHICLTRRAGDAHVDRIPSRFDAPSWSETYPPPHPNPPLIRIPPSCCYWAQPVLLSSSSISAGFTGFLPGLESVEVSAFQFIGTDFSSRRTVRCSGGFEHRRPWNDLRPVKPLLEFQLSGANGLPSFTDSLCGSRKSKARTFRVVPNFKPPSTPSRVRRLGPFLGRTLK